MLPTSKRTECGTESRADVCGPLDGYSWAGRNGAGAGYQREDADPGVVE